VTHLAFRRPAAALALAIAISGGGQAQLRPQRDPLLHQLRPWHDPSPHTAQLITVEQGVQLEVLDWGGSARPLVLLAGSGTTAHVYDGFAEKLTKYAHVYGITRRGYGESTRPASGYSEQRLAEDVLQVIDSLHLAAPVLAGHSLGGSELAVFSCAHPGRSGGLVLMDSAIVDPGKDESRLYEELHDQLPDAMNMHDATPEESRSIPLLQRWMIRNLGAALPDSDVRSIRSGNIRPQALRPKAVTDAIRSGLQKVDYGCIHVPVLAFYALPAPLEDQIQRYKPRNEEQRSAMERKYRGDLDMRRTASHALQAAAPDARIVELIGASHFVFLSNKAEVLKEFRAFLAKVP
jgi:non-heme chloroperoxidase